MSEENASSPNTRAQAWQTRPIYGGVLIGGASKRMGRSKSLLRHEGVTFAERVVNVLRPRVKEVVLLGDGPIPSALGAMKRLPDEEGLKGPLAGMIAALRWAEGACWLIAACDLPLVRVEALDWLLNQRGPGRAAVQPRIDADGVEPLLAVYEPEALELMQRLVARGVRAPTKLASEPGVHTPSPPAALRLCWRNVNTPEELRRLGGGP